VSSKSFLVVLAVLAVLALLGFGVFKPEPSLGVGEPAPTTPLPALAGSGETSIADFAGDWVLVNFWASWCAPCEEEAPAIEAYFDSQRKAGLRVLGIDTRDSTEAGLEFVDEQQLSWEFVRDGNGEAAREWGTSGVPESFLVDPDGKLALACKGAVSEEQLEALVSPLLAGETPAPGSETGGCTLG
jgi:cytochrome c biogenesis protein CcmG, thiol:disulfide interchange protein DsbE